MGNKQSSFVVDFKEVCQRYEKLIRYVNANKDLTSDTPMLKAAIRIYLKFELKPEILQLETSAVAWVWCVHKLHPLKYATYLQNPVLYRTGQPLKDMVNFLKNACIRQKSFCEKIIPQLDSFNLYVWKHEYKHFLGWCKQYPNKTIVPSLHEDFIWHSHMQDHQGYRADSFKKLNFILDHNDDIPEELLIKYKKEFMCLQKGWKYEENKTSSSCITILPIPVLIGSSCGSGCGTGTSTCGSGCGSSCGSSCGGGCGGC